MSYREFLALLYPRNSQKIIEFLKFLKEKGGRASLQECLSFFSYSEQQLSSLCIRLSKLRAWGIVRYDKKARAYVLSPDTADFHLKETAKNLKDFLTS